MEHSSIIGPSSFSARVEYLSAFQFWYSELCVENQCGREEGGRNIVFLIFVLWHCFVGGKGIVGWGGKSYSGAVEIASFSSQDLSQHNKHDSFWLVVSTGYFYVLFL